MSWIIKQFRPEAEGKFRIEGPQPCAKLYKKIKPLFRKERWIHVATVHQGAIKTSDKIYDVLASPKGKILHSTNQSAVDCLLWGIDNI